MIGDPAAGGQLLEQRRGVAIGSLAVEQQGQPFGVEIVFED